jgi:hypothetical protein
MTIEAVSANHVHRLELMQKRSGMYGEMHNLGRRPSSLVSTQMSRIERLDAAAQ